MTVTTIELPPNLDTIMTRAVNRTPAAREEFARFVVRRITRLDRPITAARIHSICEKVWHGLAVTPK